MDDECNKDCHITDTSGEPLENSKDVRTNVHPTTTASMDYVASLPERLVRAAAASGGGLVFETSELILPPPVRRSKFYQATFGRVLRITVEFVGGVTGLYPAETMKARDLAVRKTAGNAVEFASILAVGFSPLWVLAAASDITGGARTYLDAFVKELKRGRVLAENADVSSVDDLFTALGGTSGQIADTIDIPPLAVADMRDSRDLLRQNIRMIPDPRHLAEIFSDMNEAAKEQNRSLLVVSSLVAAGAIQAGIQMGNTHIFSFYGNALTTIRTEGISFYLDRISQPYLAAAASHLHYGSDTHTRRLLRRILAFLKNQWKRIRSVRSRWQHWRRTKADRSER